tara:strand:- start:23098 stop:23400 length:303 start_codon:yes stop_codon:yes gene_type:complete
MSNDINEIISNKLSDEELAKLKESWAKEQDKLKDTDWKEPIIMPEYRTEISEYKGNPMITIFLGDKRILGFGLKKAVAVTESMAAISQFVDSNTIKDKDA